MVLMCSRNEDEAVLDGSEPVLTAKEDEPCGYLLNHMVLVCSRNEDEAVLDGSEPVLTAKDGELTDDEPTLDIVIGC